MSNWYKPRYKIVKKLQEKTFIARIGRLRFFQDRRVQRFLRWKKGPLGRHQRGMTSLSWYKLRFSFGLKFYNFSTKKRRKFRFFRQDNLYKVELSRKKGFLSFYRKIDNSKVVNWFNKLYKNSRQFKLLNFFRTFESRLDVLCFRLKLMPTIFIANFFIKSQGLSINHRLVNTPGYRLQIGDLLHFTDPKVWNFFNLRLTNLLWKRWHRHQEINKVRRQTRVLTYREVLASTPKKKNFSLSEFFPSFSKKVQLQADRDSHKRVLTDRCEKKIWWSPVSKGEMKYFQLFHNLFFKNKALKALTSVKKLLLKIICKFFSVSLANKKLISLMRKIKIACSKLIQPTKQNILRGKGGLKNIHSQPQIAQNEDRLFYNHIKPAVKNKLGGISYSLSALEWLSSWVKGAVFLLKGHGQFKKILQFLMINFSVNSDLRIFFLRLWSVYRKINTPLYKVTQASGRLFAYLRILSRVSLLLPKKLHPTLLRSLYLKVLTLQFSSYKDYKEIIGSYSNKNVLNLVQLLKTFLLPLRLSIDTENAKKSFNYFQQKIDKIENLKGVNFNDIFNFFSESKNFIFLYKQLGFRSKLLQRIFGQLRQKKVVEGHKAVYRDLNLLFFSFTLNYLQDEFSFEMSTLTKDSYKMGGFTSFSKNTIDSLLFRNFASAQLLETELSKPFYFETNKSSILAAQKQVSFNSWRRVKFRVLRSDTDNKEWKLPLSIKNLRSIVKSRRFFPRSYGINLKKILPVKHRWQGLSKQNRFPLSSLVIMRERFYAKKKTQKRELTIWKKAVKGLIFSTNLLSSLFKYGGKIKRSASLSKKVINSYLKILSQKERKKLLFDNTSLFKSLRFSALTKNSLFVNKYKKILWEVLRNVKATNTRKSMISEFKPLTTFYIPNSARIKWKKKHTSNHELTNLVKRSNLLASLSPRYASIVKDASLTVNQKRDFLKKRQNRRKTGTQTRWNSNKGFSAPIQKSKSMLQNNRFKQKNLVHFIYNVENYKKGVLQGTHKKLKIRYYIKLQRKIGSLLKVSLMKDLEKSSAYNENLFRNLFIYKDSQNFANSRLKYTTMLTKINKHWENATLTNLPRVRPLHRMGRHKIKRHKKSVRYRHNWNTGLINNKWYSIRSKIQQFHKLKEARSQKFTNIKKRPLLLFPNYIEFDFVAFRALITTFPNLEASLYGGADNSYFYSLLNYYQRKGL